MRAEVLTAVKVSMLVFGVEMLQVETIVSEKHNSFQLQDRR
jgi:hypothetical protein